MRILTICLVFLVLAGSVHAADRWDGDDKLYHGVIGGGLGFTGYMVADVRHPEWRERDKVLVGWAAASAAGLAKEGYDYLDYGYFSYKDALVTSAAGLVGSLTGTSIVYIDHTVFVGRTWRW